ncbi:hypothetical protein GNI_172030 [Gregarina niphandrodes]|uniref:Uncharacterized protein n=1 Tax=Gregarina niphandrodes TaxID=110365 RepID=A0A023AXQ6_GRENI|nr:hypothetical protein GNI_172030 [Gregarina niphandrodes]EZG43437.1 hypothetical protein GNI_172030 [Gregarina niphandrodes]|eukprot:XP_011133331.1 hypothetical protein GNI_172030 [Gregarina niphandrodes]
MAGEDPSAMPPTLPMAYGGGDLEKNVVEDVKWAVEAEVRHKQPLTVFWGLPSASQAGDEELIEEDLQDEKDRRGQTKLNLPPMESIRETVLLNYLWKELISGGKSGMDGGLSCVGTKDRGRRLSAQFCGGEAHTLIELILLLTVYCEYELVVMHLQSEDLINRHMAS